MKRILLPLLILSVFAASMSAQRGNNIDARKLQLALYAISNLYEMCIRDRYNAAHHTLFSKHTDMGISSELTSYFFIYLPTQ